MTSPGGVTRLIPSIKGKIHGGAVDTTAGLLGPPGSVPCPQHPCPPNCSWMDEWRDFYYAMNPGAKNVDIGDLSPRKNMFKLTVSYRVFNGSVRTFLFSDPVLSERVAMVLSGAYNAMGKDCNCTH